MKEIGGYFELELHQGEEYHKDAIRLNTGRNAFEYVLRAKGYKKVYLPYYTCDVMLEPVKKLSLAYEFYHIDETFRPVFNYGKVKTQEVFVYTNYFGICDPLVSEVAANCKNVIIDNAQAFFSKPLPGVDTFYSPRKFFGVPDGAYLYLEGVSDDEIDLPYDHSENRMAHLLKRIEYGAEEGYEDFKANEEGLIGQPIKRMSKLTQALLSNIDYDFVRQKRRDNFLMLHKKLSIHNKFEMKLADESVPMCYPFRNDMPDLKRKLNEQRIFSPTYWLNVVDWTDENSLETKFVNNIIHLPIDQRYSFIDMKFIVNKIETFYE